MKLIALVQDAENIARYLRHLGLPTEVPPMAPPEGQRSGKAASFAAATASHPTRPEVHQNNPVRMGYAHAAQLLESVRAGRKDIHFIEVMTRPGGWAIAPGAGSGPQSLPGAPRRRAPGRAAGPDAPKTPWIYLWPAFQEGLPAPLPAFGWPMATSALPARYNVAEGFSRLFEGGSAVANFVRLGVGLCLHGPQIGFHRSIESRSHSLEISLGHPDCQLGQINPSLSHAAA